MDLFEEKIKAKDRKAIAEAAGYDFDRVRSIYEMAKKKNDISDIVGWMIAGLKRNYSEPIKGKKDKIGFNSFRQRKYDFEVLERDALNN